MTGAEVPGAGAEQELEQLISAYADVILKICFVYLSDKNQAEDAMQDTFLKAWKHLRQSSVQTVANQKAWLMRIAVNTCHDYHRSRWFRHIDARKALEDLPPRYVAVTPEDHDLLADVGQLPEKYKQVLLIYYYQEMTLQETADILGLSKSAVHKRLQKAQTLLKGRLAGRDFDA
jgi:RNA polymerase sigma-70 factor (ECF subfamily)